MIAKIDELNLPERNDLIALEMAVISMLKDDSRSGFLTRWSSVGLLIVGLATSVPLFAQQVFEYESPQIFVPRDQIETLVEYQKMLKANPRSSLANYRIAELLFKQRHYQASANYYRDALHGDGLPRWTKVWSHIELGKIFDTTAQRDRAMNEYQLALQTEDNTLDALHEAEQLLQKPYEWPRTQ
jgi:tetratricopeptide (TPR) repeat protein